jgi:hypothetical protein
MSARPNSADQLEKVQVLLMAVLPAASVWVACTV